MTRHKAQTAISHVCVGLWKILDSKLHLLPFSLCAHLTHSHLFPLAPPTIHTPSFNLFPFMSRRPGCLNALFDTPSSPLAPPSSDTINGATDTPFGSPQRPNPVTPSNSARRGSSSSPYASARSAVGSLGRRTVHTEDFSQHGTLIAARLHLKPDAVKQLEDFVKVLSPSYLYVSALAHALATYGHKPVRGLNVWSAAQDCSDASCSSAWP